MKEQPIETTPKDRRILLKRDDVGWVEGFWGDSEWTRPVGRYR